MTDPNLGDILGPHVKRLRPADEKAARAAMGIPDEATIVPMDMTQTPLLVTALLAPDGETLQIMARATMSKRNAAAVLRQVAASWEREADEAGEPERD
ncbi:hypothetical protein PBI_SMARTIES_79 [Microbacterium phage Smarties]|uniref:Uncharacterized protein n=1 Tax=Microbacterium phage Ariadne TaxID=2656546 RepID=A0A649VBY4_9CAUD|nr:hypothetical protein QDA10_gp079 [Microbacterium phage Ariadne]QGJ89482.1 hypothetical protein PBI_ARIADNE_79 [Microbacterium phage Ariadne]QGJ91469.1 hypothetical protein PBI_SMARTIES_79 [Microbacterium phage Smarties]